MKTTLSKIRAQGPCESGWRKLLTYLGKTSADDEPLSILTILKSNGLDDAIWCLRAVEGHDREIRLLAVGYARMVQHLMTDERSLAVLNVAVRFANGLATKEELEAAARSAWAVADGSTVWDAALAAASCAASCAALDAACAAADAIRATARAAWATAQADLLTRLCEEVGE